MSKRLVLCFDGLWERPPELGNSRGPLEDFTRHPSDMPYFNSSTTNVLKLYQSVSPRAADGWVQQKWYASGNVLPWFHRFRTGTFGYGLDQTILQAYAYLLLSYEPGDEIFIYGFSRGAYIARTLVGWISVSGLLPPLCSIPPVSPACGVPLRHLTRMAIQGILLSVSLISFSTLPTN